MKFCIEVNKDSVNVMKDKEDNIILHNSFMKIKFTEQAFEELIIRGSLLYPERQDLRKNKPLTDE